MIPQWVKCLFGKHKFKPARKYLLEREECECGEEIVLLPSGKWVRLN